MTALRESFTRLAKRFRRIAESPNTNRAEYLDACASGFGLLRRLNKEAYLCWVDPAGPWAAFLAERCEKNETSNRLEIRMADRLGWIEIDAYEWEMGIVELCQAVYGEHGLPIRNPLLFESNPETMNSPAPVAHAAEFRPRASNFEFICEWIAENVMELSDEPPSEPLTLDGPLLPDDSKWPPEGFAGTIKGWQKDLAKCLIIHEKISFDTGANVQRSLQEFINENLNDFRLKPGGKKQKALLAVRDEGTYAGLKTVMEEVKRESKNRIETG